MPKIECENGAVINFRYPSVIELFDLQDKCGWGKSDKSGFYRLARALENAEPFIESVEGKKDWQDCLNDRGMADDLSTLAIRLLSDELEEDKKKS
jgi:hypothetical protein